MTWTTTDIPTQTGRRAIITGATGGLGYETALALARAGATVILAGRNDAKGDAAVAKIRAQIPGARVDFATLDLASLASVEAFTDRFAAGHSAVDLLINNAGVMALPQRQTTADGFEMQFGTNYLGHFALTAHLLPLLLRGEQPRVINLSSLWHRQGMIDFADLQAERGYRPWKAYGQSKLAMLMFAFELQHRSDVNGWGLLSAAAHPGVARTDLMANGPGANGTPNIRMRLGMLLAPLMSQSAADGALPTLFAATSPEAREREYYGPDGIGELRGSPAPAGIAAKARDAATAGRLWSTSEQLTGVRFEAPVAVA